MTGAVEAILGFTGEDLLSGRVRLQDRIHSEDAETANDLLFSPSAIEESGPILLRLRGSDGRIRCLKVHASKRAGSSGAAVVELLLEDVRGIREPGDAALAASFSTLIEHTRDIVYVKNRNHVFLAASQAEVALTRSGRVPADLIGRTDYDLFPESFADISYRNEARAFGEGRRVNEFVHAAGKVGRRIWLDDRKYPVNDGAGNFAGIFGIAPNVTAYVEAQQELRDSERALREEQEIAGVGSFIFDLPGRAWKLSPQLRTILGLGETADLEFDRLWSLLHAEDQAAVTEQLHALLRGEKQSFEGEYRILHLNGGALVWVDAKCRMETDGSGRPVRLRGTVLDITHRKQSEAALRESSSLLQLFIEHAPAGLAMFDTGMRYMAASRRWLEGYGLTAEEAIGRSRYELPPLANERWIEAHRRSLAGERVLREDDPYQGPDGKVHRIRWESLPWRKSDGAIGGIVIFSEDVTRQKESEERLRLAASVFTHAGEGIVITNADAKILEVNEAFTRITGYTREEVLGKNPRILQSGIHTREFYENMWRSLLDDGNWSGEIWNRTKDGEIYVEQLTIHSVQDGAGNVEYVAHFSDATELKQRERQLEHIAHYDALTGLPNRVLLADRLRQAMAQAHRRDQVLVLAYLDLDGFKAINDRYGHEAGDSLLTSIAKRVSEAMGEGDSLARLGGDEFAAVMLDLPSTVAVAPALKKLLEAASRPVKIGEHHLRVTASVGAAIFPAPDDPDADQLLRQAGQAMYQAKLAGRNRYSIFDSRRDLGVQLRSQQLERMQRGLENGEFVLYYQPKVNMRTGELVGVEALIRWQHPDRGMLLPGQFLPFAENQPFSIELGEWVIQTALAQIEAWQETGLDLRVSVNIGALQLQQREFPERLRRLLLAHPAVQAGKLELEVLETSALQDLVQTSSVLEACRTTGVSISIDDFGTGYASLAYLRRLPVQTLKIDQSFVGDILEDPDDLSILEAVVGLATAFRREIIAEGVETVEHGVMLLNLGCELAQGYGIARPMSHQDLLRWMERWRPDPRWLDSPPLHRGNRLLLVASVEHRAWLGAFEAYLQGKRPAAPPLDPHECRFAAWLEAEREAGRSGQPAFQAIELLHEQLHGVAAEILKSHAGGFGFDSVARLNTLHRMRDEFLDSLNTLN